MAEENANPTYSSLEPMEKKKGGFTASSFIFVLLVLDHMGFMAIMVSMVLYFIYVMHLDLAHSANLLTNFMGSTYLLALVGGFISDIYLSRFTTCLIFGKIDILSTVGATIDATAIVYVSMNVAWYWGFLIATVASFIGFTVLAMGNPFYRLQVPGDSSIIRIVQVIVVAIKNRHLTQPGSSDELYKISEKETNYAEENNYSYKSIQGFAFEGGQFVGPGYLFVDLRGDKDV
ncbi:hypothetical protein DVH24_036424 [Malus domestica]|uniref:Uncharacterized protein n=1 Tax=Malus domestica TaxID=3750 RepID=A0A498ILI6_MALDO|nr:hypothetical protein DVH24_036424 [Malus domestica]